MNTARTSIASDLMRWFVGRSGVLGLQIGTLAVLARSLGPDGLGFAQFAFVIFGYGILVNDLGLTMVGLRENGRVSSRVGSPGQVLGARLMLTMPFLVVLAVVGLTGGPDRIGASLVIGLGVLASAFNLRWLLQADRRFGQLATLEVISAAIQFVAALFAASAGAGWIIGLVVLVAGPTLVALTSTIAAAAQHGGQLIPRLDREAIGLVRMALPLGVAIITTAIYYSFDTLLLGIVRGATDVGLYSAAYRIVLALLTLPVAVHGVALPVISRLSDSDLARLRSVLLGLSAGLLTAALPIAVGVAIFSQQIVTVFYGEEFLGSGPLLAILVWSLVTTSANVPFAVLLLATRRDRAYLGVTILGAVVNVGLNLAIIPAFGPIGAAATTIGCEVVVLSAIIGLTLPTSRLLLPRSLALAAPPTVGVALGAIALPGSAPVALVVSAVGCLLGILVVAARGLYRGPIAALSSPGE